MNRDDIIRMARKAGIESHQIFGGLIVRHSNGSWIDIEDELAAVAELAYAAGAAAKRQKLTNELLTLEKWKGLALAKDGDGRTVQQVEADARAAEREECAKLADANRADYTAAVIRARGQS